MTLSMTLNIMTLSIMTHSIMTLSIMTLSTRTLSKTTLTIMKPGATFIITTKNVMLSLLVSVVSLCLMCWCPLKLS